MGGLPYRINYPPTVWGAPLATAYSSAATDSRRAAAQWAHGYHIQFGLYAWSPGDGPKRTQRAATPSLAAIYKDMPARLAKAHELAVEEKPHKKANGMAAANGSPHSVLDVKPLDMARQGSDTNV